ncbi:hypothetical protein NQ318_016712 [Aromia moschata]|uniref:Polyprotein n=1 Tax=Aromia moschata TaxID=1265417 RepID=A0AAV8XGB1_9CUCU|nr:hypothetical protein NQ318_016712 [Aromia moschata]
MVLKTKTAIGYKRGLEGARRFEMSRNGFKHPQKDSSHPTHSDLFTTPYSGKFLGGWVGASEDKVYTLSSIADYDTDPGGEGEVMCAPKLLAPAEVMTKDTDVDEDAGKATTVGLNLNASRKIVSADHWHEEDDLPLSVFQAAKASTVADALIKDWICRFGVPLELHTDQGRNFESTLFQNVCRTLNIRKTRTTALHPQSDGMVERINMTINRYLSKVVSDHQRDWDQFLHMFLLAYRSSVHETTEQIPASIVMGRELRLPCDLKFGCTPVDDVAGEDYVSTLRQRMEDIHEKVRSSIQGASDRMKEIYDMNANDGRYQPGNQVWLYNPQRRRGLSPKLQSSWEGPYEVITQINDVVYRIQKLPRRKPRVVHFNQAEARVRHVSPPDSELSFEEFMLLHSNGQKARYGVTREEPRDLFQAPADFCLAHCVAADLRMSRGIALTFKKAFGQLEELRRQRPEVGRVLQITVAQQEKERSVFYLVTKHLSHHKPTYQIVWDTLVELRNVLLSQYISSLEIPKIASGLDGLDWRVIVCWKRSLNEKTVDCFFYQTSRCKNGPCCRYRHGPEDDGTIRDEMSLRRGQCGENATRMHCRPAGLRSSSATRHRVPLFSGRITNVDLDEPSVLDASSRVFGDKTNSSSNGGRASRYLNAAVFVNK